MKRSQMSSGHMLWMITQPTFVHQHKLIWQCDHGGEHCSCTGMFLLQFDVNNL